MKSAKKWLCKARPTNDATKLAHLIWAHGRCSRLCNFSFEHRGAMLTVTCWETILNFTSNQSTWKRKFYCKLLFSAGMLVGFHQVHIKAVHLKEKPYECDFCQGIFSQKGNLQTHITAVHLKEKPHECAFCQEIFSQKSSLQTNITAIHLKEKPHGSEFAKKNQIRNISKGTSLQSTSKRSLMSVPFAKKYFHRKAVSKLT